MSAEKSTPIFILSLPRSGSTLLQKILSTAPEIATVAEPWLMLPAYSYEESLAVFSLYSGAGYRQAITELLENDLKKGEADLLEAAAAYGDCLYQKLGAGKRYVLDKTPRYNLVARKLLRTFPNAKFIILWRNPLAVMASISRTWAKGTWCFPSYEIDLYVGLTELISAANEAGDNCLALKYEDFVQAPQAYTKQIADFLALDPEDLNIERVQESLFEGKMGDPTGGREYGAKISQQSVNRWQLSFQTKFRQKYASKYLEWLGEDNLKTMGYDKATLLGELMGSQKSKFSILDYIHYCQSRMKTSLQSRIIVWSRRVAKSPSGIFRLD